ncbi:hypothetical protein KKJ09_15080, partial [Xenorhabdus bovienii]|nr:hypothetical protein [Xenorhabdus bovienii]MDE9503215.1 hypothetical protein [Xenorhabdus bovienii]MDE9526974.1 hypothetical protein [Xenorhabdus bovienii]MDE9570179.1 hypothetical protein [Xenorhabdus bovienii]
MTTRSDIEKGKLVYTEKLGWVDLGHATGDDAVILPFFMEVKSRIQATRNKCCFGVYPPNA